MYGTFDATSAVNGTTGNGIDGAKTVGSYIDAGGGQYAYYASGGTYTSIDATLYDTTAIPYISTPLTVAKGVSGDLVAGFYGRDSLAAFYNGMPSSSGFIFNTTTNAFTEVDVPQTLVDAVNSASNGTQLNGVDGTTATGLYYDGAGIEHGLLYDITGQVFTTVDFGTDGTYLTDLYGNTAVGEYLTAGVWHGFTYDLLTQTFSGIDSPDDSTTAYFTGIGPTLGSNANPILTGYTIDRYNNYNAFWYQAITPEPGTYAMLGGLITAGFAMRRKRRK
jgi:hypothetical protein